MRTLTLFAFLLIMTVTGSAQTTWHVPGDFAAIQDALDDASVLEGDTILVGPGTYYENINFNGKNLTLRSSDGPADTVIDGLGVNSVVQFTTYNGASSVLDGFTITNGYGNNPYAGHGGGGIVCWDGSDPTVKNSIITKNTAVGNGGAIIADKNSSVTLTGNIISENISGNRGGAIAGGDFGCVFTITGCIIRKNSAINTAGGIAMSKYSTLILRDSLVIDNEAATAGGGIVTVQGTMTSTNNTIAGNKLTDPAGQGGGIYMHLMSTTTLTNNTITDNEAADGGGIYNYQGVPVIMNSIIWGNTGTQVSYYNSPDITYCDVQGGFAGTANFDADPLLVSGSKGAHYLSQAISDQYLSSPCIDAGSDLASNLGMDGLWTRTDHIPDASTVNLGFHYGPFAEDWYAALYSNTYFIHDDTGGTVKFYLSAGKENAGRYYLLLASLSGTKPGFPLPGGQCVLPINWDTLSHITMTYLNSYIFSHFLGTLDAAGKAAAKLHMPPIPGLAWNTMYFAYCCNNPFNFVSNPATVDIVD